MSASFFQRKQGRKTNRVIANFIRILMKAITLSKISLDKPRIKPINSCGTSKAINFQVHTAQSCDYFNSKTIITILLCKTSSTIVSLVIRCSSYLSSFCHLKHPNMFMYYRQLNLNFQTMAESRQKSTYLL